jgi:hypothetical protein
LDVVLRRSCLSLSLLSFRLSCPESLYPFHKFLSQIKTRFLSEVADGYEI